jgi:hypothetical protein
LKHATLLQLSDLPESALTYAELDYQKANVDVVVQQHLEALPDPTEEEFSSFIIGTDIGLFIFPSVTCISYHLFSAYIWLGNGVTILCTSEFCRMSVISWLV